MIDMVTVNVCMCRRDIDVDIYSIGLFKFKGVTGSYRVVQLLPQELLGRNKHCPTGLSNHRGKAVCMQRDAGLIRSVVVSIPDTSLPYLHCGWQQTSRTSTDQHCSVDLPAVVSPKGSVDGPWMVDQDFTLSSPSIYSAAASFPQTPHQARI